MAVGNAIYPTNNKETNRDDLFHATVSAPGTLNGSVEQIISFPRSGKDGTTAGNGWELVAVDLAVGDNTTWTDGEITATVEKNTDGGTTALATAPVITDAAGTGRRSTLVDETGVTVGVVHATEANRRFADSDVAFVTLSESGAAGGGADPSDVSVGLTFVRLQDFDPDGNE